MWYASNNGHLALDLNKRVFRTYNKNYYYFKDFAIVMKYFLTFKSLLYLIDSNYFVL